MAASDPDQVIQVHQPVSIMVTEAGAVASYRSVILDLTPEEEILVDPPMSEEGEIELPPDTRIGFLIPVPNGAWRWSVQVRERVAQPRPALRLSWPAEEGKLQRRGHFRIAVELAAEVSCTEVSGKQSLRRTVAGVTADLSAGGVRIQLVDPVRLQVNASVGIRLHLPDATVECMARVVRLGGSAGPGLDNPCWIAVEFVEISSSASRAITRFLFRASCQRRHMLGR